MAKLNAWKSFSVVMVLVLVAALGAAIVPASPVQAHPGTIQVDVNDAGCVSESGQSDPYSVVYCSIQDAIDDASGGDTINVAAGTYDESLIGIGKVGLTITSVAGPDTTIINSDGMLYSFKVIADDVTITGFTIQKSGSSGIYLGESNYPEPECLHSVTSCEVSNCIFKGIKAHGCWLRYCTDSLIDSNKFLEPSTGGAAPFVLLDYDSSGNVISNNVIFGNGTGGAITMQGGSNNNRIENNTFTNPFCWGIMGSSCDNLTIINNEISNSTGNGIYLGNCNNPTLDNNTVTSCGTSGTNSGIWLTGGEECANASLTNNTCTSNSCHGIDIRSTDNSTVSNNTCSSNTYNGIYVKELDNCTVSDNQLLSNGWAGFRLRSVTNSTVESNNVSENTQYGIWVEMASSNNQIIGNDILNNATGDQGVAGIRIDLAEGFEPTGTHIHFNNIVGNTKCGVSNTATEEVDATNNWWGDASGPYDPNGTVEVPPCNSDCVDDLNADGTGDKVSDSVDYCPWLGAEVEDSKTEETDPGDDTVDAKTEADTEVEKSGTGTPIVTVAKYESCPECGPTPGGFQAAGDYIDVHLDTTTNVTEIQVKNYYTAADIAGLVESSLRMYYCTGTAWLECSDSGVNTTDTDGYSGYVWAKIRRDDTTPDLTYLAGGMFGAMGTPPVAPAVTTNDATNVTTSSATLNGNLTSLGTASTVSVSFEWGTSSGVYPNEITTQARTTTGTFSSSLSGLNSGTTYYFRTKAVGNGTSYGAEKSFTVLTPAVPPVAPPASLDGSTGGPSPARLTSPELKLKYLNINPQQASANQPVTISTNVVNRGGMAGSTNVILKINGQVEESRMVSVSPGAAHPVKLPCIGRSPELTT